MTLQQIYQEYEKYLLITKRVMGESNPFCEDVLSECIIKASEIEKDITPQYFYAMVLNASKDYLRKARLETQRLNGREEMIPDEVGTHEAEYTICQLEDFLRQYEVVSIHNKFRADLFRLYYLEGKNILYLQKATGIDRKYLAAQRNIIKETVKEWLLEKRQQNQKKNYLCAIERMLN